MSDHNATAEIVCRKCGARKKRIAGRNECRPCRAEYMREYYRANPEYRERIKAQMREKHKNPEWVIAQRPKQRDKQRKRRADPGNRAVANLRTAIRCAIKRGGGVKCQRTTDIIGYHPRLLAEWARAQGYDAGYHIDHIVPFAEWRRRYPNDIVAQMRGAWNTANLRIIPAAENLAKHAKVVSLV